MSNLDIHVTREGKETNIYITGGRCDIPDVRCDVILSREEVIELFEKLKLILQHYATTN